MYTTLLILPALFSTPAELPAPAAASPLEPVPYATWSLTPGPVDPLFAPTALHVDDGVHRGPHRWYVRANGGFVTTTNSDGPGEEIDFDEGWLAGLAIGKRLTSGDGPSDFALELEGVWTQQDADTNPALADVTSIGGFLNGVFDFRLTERFSLYAGGGIGATWMDVGTNSDAVNDFDDEDGPFLSWQLKAGVWWSLTSHTRLGLGYRFLNVDDNEIDDNNSTASFDLETEQHVIELGLEFAL